MELETLFSYINVRTVILLVTLSYLIYRYTTQRNLPPGPWGIPIFGYLPFLAGKPPYIGITDLAQKYGNVMSMYMGSVLVVILSDYDSIKEAFVNQGLVFSGIPLDSPFRFKPTDSGISLVEGEVAAQHRRLIISSLRNFGVGKSSLESQIMDEVNHYMTEIKRTKSQPFNLRDSTTISLANVIALFQFEKRFEYTDANFIRLLKLIEFFGKSIAAMSIGVFLPWTKKIPFLASITGYKQLSNSVDELQDYFRKKVKEEMAHHVDGNKSNYVESYLTERNELLRQKKSEENFDLNFLQDTMSGLFGAGSQTVAVTILWTTLYTVKYPDVFKKVQQEIDDVIGAERDPTMSDKVNMPFTEATMLEVQRFTSTLPFSLVHSNMDSTTIFGHYVPKRSYVLANLYAVHHDKSLWGDPENFRPERFLTPEGRVSKPEYFIPFSIGKRNCIGESLAQMEIFLYVTSLLRQFNFKLPEGESLNLEPNCGIALEPEPFTICAIPR